jgi:hypothetical protein
VATAGPQPRRPLTRLRCCASSSRSRMPPGRVRGEAPRSSGTSTVRSSS